MKKYICVSGGFKNIWMIGIRIQKREDFAGCYLGIQEEGDEIIAEISGSGGASELRKTRIFVNKIRRATICHSGLLWARQRHATGIPSSRQERGKNL